MEKTMNLIITAVLILDDIQQLVRGRWREFNDSENVYAVREDIEQTGRGFLLLEKPWLLHLVPRVYAAIFANKTSSHDRYRARLARRGIEVD